MSNLLGEPAAPSFDDPLGMLRACHHRIERQLATLERLARHLPEHGADANASAAARSLLRYFDTAAPNHHADEEASLFPRLLGRTSAARNLIAQLEAEHADLEGGWRKLRPLIAGIASGQRANLPPLLVLDVRSRYAAHIALENEALLPLGKSLLTPEELDAIGAEMAARRGIAWSAPARAMHATARGL